MRTKSTACVGLLLGLCALSSTSLAAPGMFSPTMLSDVAEKVTPAVVNITTRRTRKVTRFEKHPMFREFFGPGSKRRLPPEMGAGSGVVVSSDGLIVTNNHVIENADEIKVVFPNKREYQAKLIGADKPSDLAFIKIEGKGLPHLPLGDSAKLRLAEWVLAIGNPFGVGQTVTLGIVSAKGRSNVGIIDYEDFIQTDAAINPGNSGGALVNLQGELVGINTAILSKSGAADGIGFAVPSNMVKPILEQVTTHGRVRRGWLGVAIQDLTPDLARNMGIDANLRGVLITEVMPTGPAAKGNLDVGDVVVAVNGGKTETTAQLRNRIALTRPGSKTSLTVLREGERKKIQVTLDEKKDDAVVARRSPKTERLLSGLAVRDLTRELRERMRVPRRVKGVVVRVVEPGSPADRAGIEEGDIITAVNRVSVRSARAFERAIPGKSKEILLRLYKRGGFTFVVLRR